MSRKQIEQKAKKLTAAEFARQMDVDYSTALRWLRLSLVPGAETEETPIGKVWQIPESALKMERPKAGRKRANEKGEQDGAAKKASNKAKKVTRS